MSHAVLINTTQRRIRIRHSRTNLFVICIEALGATVGDPHAVQAGDLPVCLDLAQEDLGKEATGLGVQVGLMIATEATQEVDTIHGILNVFGQNALTHVLTDAVDEAQGLPHHSVVARQMMHHDNLAEQRLQRALCDDQAAIAEKRGTGEGVSAAWDVEQACVSG